MPKQIILGNIATMNDHSPKAQAMVVEDGIIKYVGTRRTAERIAGQDAQVLDYSGSFIFPGIIEAHCHPSAASDRMALQADISKGNSTAEFVSLMKDYMEENPGRALYRGAGWRELDPEPTAKMLDEICPDVPMILNSIDGHSIWLNTKAMEDFGLDKSAAEQFGSAAVRTYEDGTPTGYVSEALAFEISKKSMLLIPAEEYAEAFLIWQDFAFRHGITACQDAMVETSLYIEISHLLQNSGRWKLRTYGVYNTLENDPRSAREIIEWTQDFAAKMDTERYKITGVKIFVDGVVEAHTAWLLQDYDDQPGYCGIKRFCDKEKLADLVYEANKAGFYVHAHAIGDAAVRNTLDGYEAGQLQSGNMDQRNCIAHLQIVDAEDIPRFGELNVVALVAPLWTGFDSYFPMTERYIGTKRAHNSYPIKSFLDTGAVINFHSDYPVSTNLGIPLTMYMAETRRVPESKSNLSQNPNERISRHQAMKAMTIDVAWQLGVEDQMGSLEIGKIANAVVFDFDLIEGEIEKVPDANLLATIVDGEVVYSA